VRSLAQAAHVLHAEQGQAMLLAGGTDLVPNMKRRQQTPGVLIGLRQVPELRGDLRAGHRRRPRHRRMHHARRSRPRPALHAPALNALHRATIQVATPPIRNMATLGGNLCLDTRCNYYNQNYEWRKAIDFCMKAPSSATGRAQRTASDGVCWVAPGSSRCWAVSSSDSAPALIALGAEVTSRARAASAASRCRELYHNDGMAYLTRQPDEILATVHLPALGDGWRSTYWKLRRRGSFDFPVLGVGAAVRFGKDRVVEEARVVLGAVASYPVPAPEAQALVGKKLTDDLIDEVAEQASNFAKPLDNTDFAMSWRKRMARYYIAGALRELRGDAPETFSLQGRRTLAMNL
jgi:4-hydroxybenzoyl-CoA reductase subunit beta